MLFCLHAAKRALARYVTAMVRALYEPTAHGTDQKAHKAAMVEHFKVRFKSAVDLDGWTDAQIRAKITTAIVTYRKTLGRTHSVLITVDKTKQEAIKQRWVEWKKSVRKAAEDQARDSDDGAQGASSGDGGGGGGGGGAAQEQEEACDVEEEQSAESEAEAAPKASEKGESGSDTTSDSSDSSD